MKIEVDVSKKEKKFGKLRNKYLRHILLGEILPRHMDAAEFSLSYTWLFEVEVEVIFS